MKNSKKVLSVMLGATMLASQMTAIVSAESDLISIPVDLTGYYNAGSIYTSTEGYQGSAGFPGSFYYPQFIGKDGAECFITWKNPWIDDMIDNTLSYKGIDFQLRVIDYNTTTKDNTPCIWKNTSTDSAFTTFDVQDGKYSSVELLANADTSGIPKKLLVKLDYTDGSVEYALNALPYVSNGGLDAGIYSRWSTNITCEIKQYSVGVIPKYSIPVDTDKTLASFSILNDTYSYATDDKGNVTIAPLSLEAINAEREKKGESALTALTRYSTNTFAAAVYAATLTMTAENARLQLADEIAEDIAALPENDALKYDDLSKIDAISAKVENLIKAGGTTADISNYAVFEAAKKTVEGLEPVDSIVDLSGYYTRGNIYTSGTDQGLAGCPGSFDYEAFKALKYWTTQWTDGMSVNTLKFKNTLFELKVADYTKDQSEVVVSNGVNGGNEWVNIDVTDGHYNAVKFLANSSSSDNNGAIFSVRLNYADGTVGYGTGTLASYFSNTKGADDMVSTTIGGGKAGVRFIKYPVDITKTLKSIDILSWGCTLTETDGVYSVTGTVKDNATYSLNMYAMTLESTKATRKSEIITTIEDAIDSIPNPPTLDNKAELQNIAKLIEEAKAMGVTEDEIYNYSVYLQMLSIVDLLEPVDVIVDMTDLYNINDIYTSDQDHKGVVSWANSFDYDSFKALPNWLTPWTDGMKTNKLSYNNTTFKLKVVDFGNGDKDRSNVVMSNGRNNGETWLNVDVDDNNYSAVKFLANSSSTGSYNGNILSARLNYSDGSFEYVTGTTAVFCANAKEYLSSAFTPAADGGRGGICYISYPVDSSKTLVSYDILSLGCTLAEDTTAEGGYKVEGTVKQYSYAINIYAMTLVSNKGAVTSANESFISEINEKIAALTGEKADYANYAAVKAMIDSCEDRGINTADIENIARFNEISKNYAVVADVSVSNDNKNAYAAITFDRAITEDIMSKATFTLLKDGNEVSGLTAEEILTDSEITGVKLTFAHGLAYDAKWEIAVKVGGAIDYKQPVELVKPYTLENVKYYNADGTQIKNFDAATGSFKVTADVNKTVDTADIYLALYNDKDALVSAKKVNAADNLDVTFTVSDEMNGAWTLKYYVWDGMNPYTEAKAINKTYGYDNVVDQTKDLTVVYFGDSQTQGKAFTAPLDNSFELQRSINNASYTGINSGVGGTSSQLGIYRLDSDVIAHNPDLVFVEFYPNDWNISGQGKDTAAANAELAKLISYHENIIKRLTALDHVPVIIYMNPMEQSAEGEDSYNTQVVKMLSGLLSHYDIPTMDFDAYARSLIATGEYTWDDFRIASNNVHFTSKGGQICADWMYDLLVNHSADYVKMPKFGAADFQSITYAAPKLVPAVYAHCDANWKNIAVDTITEGYWYPVSENPFPQGYMASNVTGSEMTFKFSGTSLYIFTLIGPKGGKAEYEIDGVYSGTVDTYTASSGMYKMSKTVKTGLENKEHTVTFKVVEPNTNASGDISFGVGYFMVEE